MPLIEKSAYRPPPLFRDRHVQTIYPFLFRKVAGVHYRRERIRTPDGDFLDLDWCEARPAGRGARVSELGENLVVISHGLEANSQWAYIRGMVRAFTRRGFDALAWNFRGCGGQDNLAFATYHGGATEDLHAVLSHAANKRNYHNIVLVGFSMGANLSLKYLGELGADVDPRIRKAVMFSAPLDLDSCARVLARPDNRVYMDNFIRTQREKVKAKHRRFPGRIDPAALRSLRTFREIDDLYTAPANGFENAEDYWRRSSSVRLLKDIRVDTLLVSAADDPFLSPDCFPWGEAQDHDYLYFEAPRYGGHVGFIAFNRAGEYWSERRALEFVQGKIFV